MYIHDQTEQAYKNGYEAGKKEAQAEIERLRKFLNMSRNVSLARRNQNLRKDELLIKIAAELKTAKSKAIKEFWNKLKRKQKWDVDLPNYILVADGDNLVKEMELGK